MQTIEKAAGLAWKTELPIISHFSAHDSLNIRALGFSEAELPGNDFRSRSAAQIRWSVNLTMPPATWLAAERATPQLAVASTKVRMPRSERFVALNSRKAVVLLMLIGWRR
jgi:hypothetical protein